MSNSCAKFYIILILVLASLNVVNAQNDIVVRIRVKVNASACGQCNHNPIKTVNLCLKDAKDGETTVFEDYGMRVGELYAYRIKLI